MSIGICIYAGLNAVRMRWRCTPLVGEEQNQPIQPSFNVSLKVDFQGSRVTSEGDLILVRELDERLGLGKLIEEQLSDSRQGLNKQFTLTDLLRQSVYSRLAGDEDLIDAERLAVSVIQRPSGQNVGKWG